MLKAEDQVGKDVGYPPLQVQNSWQPDFVGNCSCLTTMMVKCSFLCYGSCWPELSFGVEACWVLVVVGEVREVVVTI